MARLMVKPVASKWLLGLAVIGVLLAGCVAPRVPKPIRPPVTPMEALRRLDVSAYPQFDENGDTAPLLRSIDASLAYLRRLPAERKLAFGPDAYSVAHLVKSLEFFAGLLAASPSNERLNAVVRQRFRVYQAIGQSHVGDVLFTGYYEPLLRAGRMQTSEYTTPVHPKPLDMVKIDLSPFADDLKGRTIIGRYTGKTVVPYPTRNQIRENVDFNAISPPIIWLRDQVDLLILQIQGSGRVELEDGTQLHILYDGSNGRPYRSIGKLLIEEGRVSRQEMSMQAIRTYLKQHPGEANRILDHNPRYIFFKTAEYGPVGALGEPLTPMRSIAVDPTLMPFAALAFISVPLPRVNPDGGIGQWQPYTGFALAQDTGSAITGPGHIDLFMGHGLQAEVGAGHLKRSGALYFLILKPEKALSLP
jgi:membrane-bound lytic murein transglycosylase A